MQYYNCINLEKNYFKLVVLSMYNFSKYFIFYILYTLSSIMNNSEYSQSLKYLSVVFNLNLTNYTCNQNLKAIENLDQSWSLCNNENVNLSYIPSDKYLD